MTRKSTEENALSDFYTMSISARQGGGPTPGQIKKVHALLREQAFRWDEHGPVPSWPKKKNGSTSSLQVLDYVTPAAAKKPPYLDMGGRGMALVRLAHLKCYKDYRPSRSVAYYLVGRNESGTAFAHALPSTLAPLSVGQALAWVWRGAKVVQRAGDVGIAKGVRRAVKLPFGHDLVDTDQETWRVVHVARQHADLPVPPGHRIVVGQRALLRGKYLPASSRD